MDRTGVGEAVVDIFKERGLQFTAIIITGSKEANRVGGGYSIRLQAKARRRAS